MQVPHLFYVCHMSHTFDYSGLVHSDPKETRVILAVNLPFLLNFLTVLFCSFILKHFDTYLNCVFVCVCVLILWKRWSTMFFFSKSHQPTVIWTCARNKHHFGLLFFNIFFILFFKNTTENVDFNRVVVCF